MIEYDHPKSQDIKTEWPYVSIISVHTHACDPLWGEGYEHRLCNERNAGAAEGYKGMTKRIILVRKEEGSLPWDVVAKLLQAWWFPDSEEDAPEGEDDKEAGRGKSRRQEGGGGRVGGQQRLCPTDTNIRSSMHRSSWIFPVFNPSTGHAEAAPVDTEKFNHAFVQRAQPQNKLSLVQQWRSQRQP